MKKTNQPLSFASIALALANDYSRLFVIDSEDDSYVEYSPSGDEKELVQVNSGDDFFRDARRDCKKQVWAEDHEFFLDAFRKEAMVSALENGQSFSLTYRLDFGGTPRYFFMKAIRASDHNIIIGVQDVDAQKRRELEQEAASATYAQIAGALASRYEVIYHINIDTNEYTRYSASEQYSRLGTTKQGNDFFADAAADIRIYIHPDDVQHTLERLSKERLLNDLQRNGTVSISYRQQLNGKHQHVNMLVVQPLNDTHHIVIGVFNTDAQVRREQQIREQNRTFSDIAMALARQYEVIYHVNTRTNEYTEYSTSEKYSKLKVGAKGKDFFADTQMNMQRDIYPDDLPMMMNAMEKENILKTLSASGKAFLNYRLMIDGRPQFMTLYAVCPKGDPEHIIITIANVDAAKRMELAYEEAMNLANRDALTSVKNKRAYAQVEEELDKQIENGDYPPFGIVVCDLNGLKQVNDTQGHKAGDIFIRGTCRIICDIYAHSPVFRIGGDEFAVLLRDQDYDHRYDLKKRLLDELEQNRHGGIRALAFGMSEFDPEKDMRVQDVFERADALMYADKKACKEGNGN